MTMLSDIRVAPARRRQRPLVAPGRERRSRRRDHSPASAAPVIDWAPRTVIIDREQGPRRPEVDVRRILATALMVIAAVVTVSTTGWMVVALI